MLIERFAPGDWDGDDDRSSAPLIRGHYTYFGGGLRTPRNNVR